jgi:hypothetical protein
MGTFLILLLRAASVAALAASSPVAVVADIGGAPPGIQLMDYVVPGQVIHLGPQDTVVLGYLRSCWNETITGGTVTVGTEQSDVQGGKVEREKVTCEGGKMMLTAELAGKSGAMVFREAPKRQLPTVHPEFTLYGLSPVIEVKPNGVLVIERVDQPSEHYEITLAGADLLHGRFLDVAKVGVTLAAGGIYRAKAGTQEMIFQIDRQAKPGPSPLVGRLLRLQPAT